MGSLIGFALLSSALAFGCLTIGILLTDYTRRKRWQKYKDSAVLWARQDLEKSQQMRWGGPRPRD